MQLEQEKFESLKELAQIQTNIAEGRAALLALQANAEAYMQVREQEAEERVARVLKESHDSLQKISHNQDQLIAFRNELKAYADELKGFSSTIATLFDDFAARMKEADEAMKKHEVEVAEKLREIKVIEVGIAEDRKQLARERQETNEARKALLSDRAALQAAWDHLKAKQ